MLKELKRIPRRAIVDRFRMIAKMPLRWALGKGSVNLQLQTVKEQSAKPEALLGAKGE